MGNQVKEEIKEYLSSEEGRQLLLESLKEAVSEGCFMISETFSQIDRLEPNPKSSLSKN